MDEMITWIDGMMAVLVDGRMGGWKVTWINDRLGWIVGGEWMMSIYVNEWIITQMDNGWMNRWGIEVCEYRYVDGWIYCYVDE